MAASKLDAEIGWAIYRDSDFAASLGEINTELTRRGFSEVSPRTYQHYGKLQRYGYVRYVPINQLDVKTLQDPFVDRATRSRVHPIQTSTPVRLRVLDTRSGEVRDFGGIAIELATTESVIRLEGRETTDFFDDLGRSNPVAELVFPDTGEIRRGRIERLTLSVEDQLSTVRVNFGESLDLAPIVSGGTRGDIVRLEITIGVSEHLRLREAARHLYFLSQAADAAALASAELGVLLGERLPAGTQPPEITGLHLASLDVALEMVLRAGGLLGTGLLGALGARELYWRSTKTMEEAKRLRWENERKGVEWRSDGQRLLGWARKLRSGQITSAPQAELDPTATPSAEQLNSVRKVVDMQLMPAVSEIVELADGDVEVRFSGLPQAILDALRSLELDPPSGESDTPSSSGPFGPDRPHERRSGR
jgi:hypothetical protein